MDNLKTMLALGIVVIIVIAAIIFSGSVLSKQHINITTSINVVADPYSSVLNVSNFNLTNLINLQNNEFYALNKLNLTFSLLLIPTPQHVFNYRIYDGNSVIRLPYTESLIEIVRSKNGTYISGNYVYINYTSVFKTGDNFYGCTDTSCFNATSTSAPEVYQDLAILNFSSLDGFGNKNYTIHLANLHQTSYNGYPCSYFSIIRTNSSPQYQGNVSICISTDNHIPVQVSYIITSNSSKTLLLNFTVININKNVNQSQVSLPAPVNNSELNK